MQSIKVKGKDYIPVSERIKHLSAEFDYSIITDFTYFEERKMWVVKATLTIHATARDYVYTGLAQEIESGNYKEVNFASALENAETSAVGRACAMAGIGIDGGIASADEVQKAIARQEEKQEIITVSDQEKDYLLTLLDNSTYDDRQRQILKGRINNITAADFVKASNNLLANQIEDKDRIAMGLNYNQNDIKQTLKNL